MKPHELRGQVAYFRGASVTIFGQDSPLSTGLGHQILDMAKYCQVFANFAACDEFFCAKFLFALDFKSQWWLTEWRDAGTDRSEVDDAIVDFVDIVNEVLNRNFNRTLPVLISILDIL